MVLIDEWREREVWARAVRRQKHLLLTPSSYSNPFTSSRLSKCTERRMSSKRMLAVQGKLADNQEKLSWIQIVWRSPILRLKKNQQFLLFLPPGRWQWRERQKQKQSRNGRWRQRGWRSCPGWGWRGGDQKEGNTHTYYYVHLHNALCSCFFFIQSFGRIPSFCQS